MRVLVCGGRDYTDKTRINNALTKMHMKHGITILIEGAARGADTLARQWAEQHGIEVKSFKANWAEHGHAAGPMRNQAMLIYGMPEAVVAFPGGTGTADMKRRAAQAGLPIYEPYK